MGLISLFSKKKPVVHAEENTKQEDEYKDMDEVILPEEEDSQAEQINESVNYEELLKDLKLTEINKIRNILDKKEEELTGNYKSSSEKKDSNNQNFEVKKIIEREKSSDLGEINIDAKVTDDQLDNEVLYEENKQKEGPNVEEENEEPEQSQEEEITFEDVVEEDSETQQELNQEEVIENNFEDMIKDIKDKFGEENTLPISEVKLNYEQLKDKNITQVVVRNIKAFDEEIATLDQNSWFIDNIKKIDKFAEFKMLSSEMGNKDLAYEDETNDVLVISFRATEFLKDKNSL